MLRYLHIQNLAIADDLEISFHDGFNVMTGETGAGKSIIVDAVGLLSGGRAYRDMIRTGAERAVVEGVFDDPDGEIRKTLGDMSLPVEDVVTVKRIIQQDGPSRAMVNGELVSLGQLSELGRTLVQIHSQNDQQMLLQPEHHLHFLDAFAKNEPLLTELARHHEAVRTAKSRYRELSMDEHQKNQRIDMLRFQIREIETAAVEPDELENLTERKTFLKHTNRIRDTLQAMEGILDDPESGSLGERVGRLHQLVASLGELQTRFQPYLEPLEQLEVTLGELERDMAQAGIDLEEDGPSLDEIESRLVEIERIMRKYGDSVSAIQEHLNTCRTELSTLEELDLRLKEQEEEVRNAHEYWLDAARTLSGARRQAAERFSSALAAELKQLDMPDVRVRFNLDITDAPDTAIGELMAYPHTPQGLETAEILISPNVGEELKPLVKIASGGEVSRIMLAVNLLTGPEGQKTTAVFDEVDAGIGGKTAVALADKIKELAGRRQVLCVTHLGQVAAAAHIHFRVQKSVVDGRTRTMVESLSKDKRLEEIARMTGGKDITDTSLKHAAELIGGDNG